MPPPSTSNLPLRSSTQPRQHTDLRLRWVHSQSGLELRLLLPMVRRRKLVHSPSVQVPLRPLPMPPALQSTRPLLSPVPARPLTDLYRVQASHQGLAEPARLLIHPLRQSHLSQNWLGQVREHINHSSYGHLLLAPAQRPTLLLLRSRSHQLSARHQPRLTYPALRLPLRQGLAEHPRLPMHPRLQLHSLQGSVLHQRLLIALASWRGTSPYLR